MAKRIEKKTEIVSNEMLFKWSFINFSVENLLEGVIVSLPFKCFNTDFHFKISRQLFPSDQQIQLQLVQSDSEDLPRISKCSIGFWFTDPSKWHNKMFLAPVKSTDIFYAISFDTLKKDCISNNELTVACRITVSTLKHMAVNEKKNVSNQGHTILAENIGNILEDSRFSDVTLKVGEESFHAHKAILASRSKVFDGMFQSGMKESQESVVEVMDMKPTVVKEMMQYIYAGTIRALSTDRAIDLYVAADRYDLQELKGWCKEFILDHISPDDVCRVAVIADLHSDEELTNASKLVIKKNPKKVVDCGAWSDFKKKHPSLHADLLESALLSDC